MTYKKSNIYRDKLVGCHHGMTRPQIVDGETACNMEDKVHRCTGTEALYRPYGP